MSTPDTAEREHLLSTLEPEEREAMLLEIDDNTRDMRAASDDDGPDDDGDDESGAAAPPVEGKPAATEAPPPAAPPAAGTEAAASPPAEPAAIEVPSAYVSKLPDDFADKLQKVQADADALAEEFKAGDIDFDQYRVKSAELQAQRDELATQRVKADISAEMQQQAEMQARIGAVNRLFAEAPKAGIDYEKDEAAYEELQGNIKLVQGLKAFAAKPFADQLAEAHRRVMLSSGATPPAQVTPTAAPAPTSRKAPPMNALPPSISQVPGGDGPGDLAGEFVDVDRLEGDALEDAIRAMSPALRERYFAGR